MKTYFLLQIYMISLNELSLTLVGVEFLKRIGPEPMWVCAELLSFPDTLIFSLWLLRRRGKR